MKRTPAPVKIALCVSAAIGVHLSVFALIAPPTNEVLIQGGSTRVKFGGDAAYLDAAAAGPAGATPAAAEPDVKPPEPAPETKPAPRPEPSPAPVPEPSPRPAPEPAKPPPSQQPSGQVQEPAADAATSTERQSGKTADGTGEADDGKSQGASGSAPGKRPADSTATGDGQTASTEGNSESSNYAGLVMRHLSGIPRPRAPAPGSAYISFTVETSGKATGISVSRSSGSSKFDREALKVVERASPFPKPPPGVNRTFEVRIEGH